MLRRLRIASPVGRRGERVAARWLRRQRYRVIGRNVRAGVGEADIVCIAPDRRTLVIVEVKSRVVAEAGAREIRGEESVGAAKRRKLRLVAESISRRPGLSDRPVRIDVVGVDLPGKPRGRAVVRHHVGAVGG